MKSLLNWIDSRTGYRGVTHAMLFEHIPGGARWRYVWGSTLVFTFAVQVITGFFLWMNYSPSSQTAWESVYYIQHQMTLGWLLRGIHHFTAQMMVVLLALHMMQVIIDGAYRAPREFNFWIGLALLLITLALGLTGYLLPWDQRGYWSTKVATNLATIMPVAGPAIQRLAVGGADYGHHTLTRFFALHAGLLPLLFIALTGIHVYLFRRHGITAKLPRKQADAHFWVDQVLKDAVACLAVLVTVLFLVFWPWIRHAGKITSIGQLGAELSAPADPSNAFSAARPEWYFLFLFQFLKFPLFKGHNEIYGAVVIPGAIFLVLALMPILGRWRAGHWFNVWFIVSLFTGIVLLTLMALAEDVGWPHLPLVGFVGKLPFGFGMTWLVLLILGTVVLAVLLGRGGHVQAYMRGLIGLVVLILAAALLAVWSLAPGSDRFGSRDWSVAGLAVPWWSQGVLMSVLLAAVALLITIALLREPYSMRDVAGFSHRWQWLHRGRLALAVLLLGGVVVAVGANVLADAGSPRYVQAAAEARQDAARVVVLAGSPDGIPPTGAASLLRLDPKTQGPRYFARNCSSCHRYGGHDGMGNPVDESTSPQSAPDLKDFATREWIRGMMDPKQVDSLKYFGPHMEAHTGKMVEFVKENVPDAEPSDKAELDKIILALSAEAALPGQREADAKDAREIELGRGLMSTSDVFECTDCHQYRDKQPSLKGRNRGPDLTGYGSREWLINIIRNPAHERFYGERNDRMPLYGEKKILDDDAIMMIADWLRGEWYEPGNQVRPRPTPDLPPGPQVPPVLGTAKVAPDVPAATQPATTRPAEPAAAAPAEGADAASAGGAGDFDAAAFVLTAVAGPPATAPAAGKVDFVKQIKPILEASCVKCHGPEKPTNGYTISTKAKAFTAGDSEQDPIVPGKAAASNVYQLIATRDVEHRMPQKGPALKPEQVALIKRWIDEGATWPEGVELDTSKAKDGEKAN